MVAAVLVDTYVIWDELQSYVKAKYPNITGEWKYYGKASGWCFKLISEKRNLLFFIPLKGCFRVRIILGEKVVTCAEAAGLPDEVKEVIRAATPYVEGRGVDIDVNRREQLESIKILVKIKFEN